ncbi:ribonuclease T2 [Malassezia obtusa]|uniref:ribonuclease T2 n=1 Tax=Malassezia obtusa TaxID=76774 RepID=A0AAF0IXG7_9BASI|nr:ribonuclease T2 [Malassezia obtusa]
MKAAVLVGAILAASAHAKLYSNTSTSNHTCALQKPVTSCSAAALNLADIDTCCQETYGGLVLSTQFWSTYTGLEDEGQLLPKHHWTLHGLWPDLCNGSYAQYCDFDRQYDPEPSPAEFDGKTVPKYHGPGVDKFVESFGRLDLLKWMNTFWISQGQPNKAFWAHEFSKHATCYSTFDTPCYGKHYQKHQDVVEFFETAAMFYTRLPTYDWLKEAGIVPSNHTSYSLHDITSALEKKYGAKPYIGCSGPRRNETSGDKHDEGRTVLSEVWYFSHVKGRPQEGHANHIDSTTNSTCSSAHNAIKYYERTPKSERSVHGVLH